MLSEHYIQNQIRLWCGDHGYPCFRCNVGKVLTAQNTWFDTGLPNGFSDLLILLPGGKVIFCECKTAKGRQREDQKNFQKLVEGLGFKYIMPHSLDEFISNF